MSRVQELEIEVAILQYALRVVLAKVDPDYEENK